MPMSYTTLFFDLDDTLYPNSTGLWQAIRARMSQYMVERLGLPADQVPELRRTYYITYGTTLRGLQKHYYVDADDYLAYVHDLPLERYLQPDASLRTMLLSLPQRRFIFTNADSNHALRVLSVLELSGCFDRIIDVHAMEFACKPEPIAFQRALAIAENPDPQQCVILDDHAANLVAARQLGFSTVLISQNGEPHPEALVTLHHLGELPEAMPGLWSEDSKENPKGLKRTAGSPKPLGSNPPGTGAEK
jgi:putative hydrolase of the HAD superfamily